MSKSTMGTKEIILNQSLKMFNERGIEYVGLREIAAELDIRVSNITYYFPTKDDLVFELSSELTKLNASVIVVREELTLYAFLEMLHRVFQHHIQYRCLLLSFVHLVQQNKKVADAYKKTQALRSSSFKANLEVLAKAGYINISSDEDLQFLVSTLALISRFWISEAAISFRKWSVADQMDHYLHLIAKLVHSYATAKGKKEIRSFFDNFNSARLF